MLFSWLGFLLGILGLWLAPRWKHGWGIAALASIPWLIYAIPVSAWALVATSLVYGTIDLVNYRRALKNDSKTTI